MEKTSISLDGKPDIKEQLQLKTFYEGPEGKLSMYYMDSVLWVACRYDQNLRITHNYLRAIGIAVEFFAFLKENGIKEVYCTAETHSEIRFNEMLGFNLIGLCIQDKHEVMVKEL